MLTDDESKPETDPIIGRLFCAPLFAPLLIHSVVHQMPLCQTNNIWDTMTIKCTVYIVQCLGVN